MDLQQIKSIRALPIAGKAVFLRLDLNVPMEAGRISDDTRIKAALPTVQFLVQAGAKVVVASHFGRPKGKVDLAYSLRPVADFIRSLALFPVHFVEDCVGPRVATAVKNLKGGEVLLLENTRFYSAEENNDSDFSKQLAEGMDVYINDAFGAMHRAHASTAGMATFFRDKGIGFLAQAEIKALGPLLKNPEAPFALILGGAKVSDKIGIIRFLLPKIHRLVIGGGMAFTFLKAKGVAIGKSICDDSKLSQVKETLEVAEQLGVQVVLPVDFRVADGETRSRVVQTLNADEMGLDIGPDTTAQFKTALQGAKTIFWNGPLGMFEKPAFRVGTLEVAKAVASSPAYRVVGGGDTLAALRAVNMLDKVDFASTGGGVTLEFLEGKELPGLKVLVG